MKKHRSLNSYLTLFKLLALTQIFIVQWLFSGRQFFVYVRNFFLFDYWTLYDFLFGPIMAGSFLIIEALFLLTASFYIR